MWLLCSIILIVPGLSCSLPDATRPRVSPEVKGADTVNAEVIRRFSADRAGLLVVSEVFAECGESDAAKNALRDAMNLRVDGQLWVPSNRERIRLAAVLAAAGDVPAASKLVPAISSAEEGSALLSLRAAAPDIISDSALVDEIKAITEPADRAWLMIDVAGALPAESSRPSVDELVGLRAAIVASSDASAQARMLAKLAIALHRRHAVDAGADALQDSMAIAALVPESDRLSVDLVQAQASIALGDPQGSTAVLRGAADRLISSQDVPIFYVSELVHALLAAGEQRRAHDVVLHVLSRTDGNFTDMFDTSLPRVVGLLHDVGADADVPAVLKRVAKDPAFERCSRFSYSCTQVDELNEQLAEARLSHGDVAGAVLLADTLKYSWRRDQVDLALIELTPAPQKGLSAIQRVRRMGDSGYTKAAWASVIAKETADGKLERALALANECPYAEMRAALLTSLADTAAPEVRPGLLAEAVRQVPALAPTRSSAQLISSAACRADEHFLRDDQRIVSAIRGPNFGRN